jgi:Mn-dependent DtxR family transcriptional regulator
MKRFSLRLSEQEHTRITAYANFWEMSVNDAIREAIRALVGNPQRLEPLDSPAILPHPADAEDGD